LENKKLKVTKKRKIIKKYMKEKHTMFFFASLQMLKFSLLKQLS